MSALARAGIVVPVAPFVKKTRMALSRAGPPTWARSIRPDRSPTDAIERSDLLGGLIHEYPTPPR